MKTNNCNQVLKQNVAPGSLSCRRKKIPAAFILGFCALLATLNSEAQFPGQGDDTTGSMGVFRITVDPAFYPLVRSNGGFVAYAGYSGGKLTSPLCIDNATTIGRSAPHIRPYPFGGGIPIGAGSWDSISGYADYPVIPSLWTAPPAGTDEVLTEIRSFLLSSSGSAGLQCPPDPRIPSVPLNWPMIKAGPNQGVALRSLGIVQENNPLGPNFPAHSFFDIFVEVNLPRLPGTKSDVAFPVTGAVLYNDSPLVITNLDLNSFPPTVVYIHGETTAVPLKFKTNNPPYWSAGDVFGYLVLAGHGTYTNADCSNTGDVNTLLDAALGPVGASKPELPVPWLRPTNTCPTPGTTYDSVRGTNSDGSSLDAVIFPVGPNGVRARNFRHGNFPNPIHPPTPGNAATYTAPNTTVSLEVSLDGGVSWQPAQANGPLTTTISNNSGGGTYDTEMLQLDLTSSSPPVVNDPSLPVVYPDGVYRTPAQIHATFHGGALTVVLQNIEHRPFNTPPIVRTNNGVDEFEQFNSQVLGQVSVNGGPFQPFNGGGPVQTKVMGKVGQETGTFQTEMLSMSLEAGTGLMIRESPTLASLGQTKITDLGNGTFQVDSFFDVFTELSLDNGQTWIPADGPAHVVAVNPQAQSFMIRESPTKQSLGKHTITPDPRGYRISSFFDVFLELSMDNGTSWTPADRSIRVQPSAPPAAPNSLYVTDHTGNSITLDWLGSFTPQSAPAVTGPYTDMTPNAVTGPLPVTTGSSAKFFRLRQ